MAREQYSDTYGQYSEEQEWAEGSDEEHWPVAEPEQARWPIAGQRRRGAVEPDEDEDRWETSGRRRTGRLRLEVPPIVNPYSIVALVAALLGLFPVAIVFGFISYGHPRGRVMAMFALLIGMAEVVALAGLLVLIGVRLPQLGLPARYTGDEASATALTAPAQSATTAVIPTVTVPIAVVSGQMCANSQVALIGSTTDGSTLLCLQGAAGYRWTGPYTVSSTVAEGGAKCLTGSDKTARTADGHALVCEGSIGHGNWSLWVD